MRFKKNKDKVFNYDEDTRVLGEYKDEGSRKILRRYE
jgi:hypothetical protein